MIHLLRKLFVIVRSRRRTRPLAAQGTWLTLLLAGLIAYGTIGIYHFEHGVNPSVKTVGDALWWSVVTMTTVGYGDIFPTTWEGRWLVAVPLMVVGIGVLGYAIGILTSAVIERQSKESKGMLPYTESDHVVICNCPSEEVVLEVAAEIRADSRWAQRDLVIVTDELEELPDAFRKAKLHWVRGNPSRESALEQAGVARAHSVMILARDARDPASDNHTLGALVTVRALAPDAYVVAECTSAENTKLLQNAGAHEVVGVESIVAELMVQALQDPGVNGVLQELVTNRTGHQIYIEPLTTFRGTFAELQAAVASKGRYAILGLVRDGANQFLPDPASAIEPGDKVMLIGDRPLSGL